MSPPPHNCHLLLIAFYRLTNQIVTDPDAQHRLQNLLLHADRGLKAPQDRTGLILHHKGHCLLNGGQGRFHVGTVPLVAHHGQKRLVGRQHRTLGKVRDRGSVDIRQVHTKPLAAQNWHPGRHREGQLIGRVYHRVQRRYQTGYHIVQQCDHTVDRAF